MVLNMAKQDQQLAHPMKIMELIGFPELIVAVVCFLFIHNRCRIKDIPTEWPLVGMGPGLLVNLHRIHDWVTSLLSKNGCTFVFKGPWFTNMAHIVVTSDPANIRYIFNTNFSNYPKGTEFNEFFDVLGDGIFNADYDSWKLQRKIAHQLINHKKFQMFLEQTSYNEVQNALIPVLEHATEHNLVVDLQDMFKRFTFDTTLILVAGIDPCSLSIEFNHLPHFHAFDDLEEAIFYRHALPMKLWKLQRWLGIGKEKKFSKAREILDEFVAQCISRKIDSIQSREKQGSDLLTSYLNENQLLELKSEQFIRDTVVNLLIAGRSTLSSSITWFFWLVSKNPAVETKIIEELKTKSFPKESNKLKLFAMEDLQGLVYLQGALCESLRLCPPIPFEHKRPISSDTLPSGHRVDRNTKILPYLYGMGRMEEVWGKDCLEFKPERWITEKGIEYVPSYKFMAFNSGPRTCIGKEISFTQMKMVAANLLYNYHVEPLHDHSMSVKNSVILYSNDGINVRIKKRLLI